MAITDIVGYSHLTPGDLDTLTDELDAIRRDVQDTLGTSDAAYIHRVIRFQRLLELTSRLSILCPWRGVRWLGVIGLAVAKSVENMELGHNIGHGQWDWMNDPEIHSATWEWDMVGVSAQWRYAHNYEHHQFTNVLGKDYDIGWDVLRVTRDQPWEWRHAFQPLQSLLLAATFEWAIALYGLASDCRRFDSAAQRKAVVSRVAIKIQRQIVKDFLVFPLLAGGRRAQVLRATLTANVLRNLWTHAVIVCGHFPDGAEKFTPESIGDERRPQWYLRQMLGTANFDAGRLLAFASGHLCYQIEHHLFPDLPSSRYPEIALRVRALCDKYDLPYNSRPFLRQLWLAQRTILKLSLPDRFLIATSDDAPETASDRRFEVTPDVDGHGLRTALARLREAKQGSRFQRRRLELLSVARRRVLSLSSQ
ncbi:fatty acid desaturase family protein [Mycolicibacterium iranicum]|uniref:fatty acid desaturase family protein n=1 Tax=Mycolicibacterium iranicum TaxID=912594 RepID=UPI0004638F44|nr:acyl-CoA desaturase [Mycolicibacterium iranicum]